MEMGMKWKILFLRISAWYTTMPRSIGPGGLASFTNVRSRGHQYDSYWSGFRHKYEDLYTIGLIKMDG
jgi:hypothetical protein